MIKEWLVKRYQDRLMGSLQYANEHNTEFQRLHPGQHISIISSRNGFFYLAGKDRNELNHQMSSKEIKNSVLDVYISED